MNLSRLAVRSTGSRTRRAAILIKGLLLPALGLESSLFKALPRCNEVREVNHGVCITIRIAIWLQRGKR